MVSELLAKILVLLNHRILFQGDVPHSLIIGMSGLVALYSRGYEFNELRCY